MVDAHWASSCHGVGVKDVNLKWELAMQSGKGALGPSKDGQTASMVPREMERNCHHG